MYSLNQQITNQCRPLMTADILDALAMSREADTTMADPANMPGVPGILEDQLTNLPQDLDSAIARIRALETALDDLNRASEIAEYSGQFEILTSFRVVADELLTTKIQVDHSTPTEMNITIVS